VAQALDNPHRTIALSEKLRRSIAGPIRIPYDSVRGFTGPSAFANLLKLRLRALS
jgi:hypothetical protein